MTDLPESHELKLGLHETHVAAEVFNGIYDALAAQAQTSGKEGNPDPARSFVERRLDLAQVQVEPLRFVPVRSGQLHDQLVLEMRDVADKTYPNDPTAHETRLRRANRIADTFIDRASRMLADGETDRLTAKLFFSKLDTAVRGLGDDYNTVVKKSDEEIPGGDAKEQYQQGIRDVFDGYSDIEAEGSFVHLNVDRYRNNHELSTKRLYISPKLNDRPAEVVGMWVAALEAVGLSDRLYYKVAVALSRRYDTIVAFVTPDIEADMERAVQDFEQRCPAELLSDSTMPSGVPVAKGISWGPEPLQLNTLLRYRGMEIVSHTLLMTGLTELALRRAAYDFVRQGMSAEIVTPKQLAAAAEPYFIQLVELSGIDPVSMKSSEPATKNVR